MKRILLIVVCGLGALAFAQNAPKITAEQKVAVLEAQHKIDTIERQQKDLALQFMQIQQKVQKEESSYDDQRKLAETERDKAIDAAKAGVDEKKWTFNADSLTFTAVPPPAAPANAAQPAKPVPGSPGAADPQVAVKK